MSTDLDATFQPRRDGTDGHAVAGPQIDPAAYAPARHGIADADTGPMATIPLGDWYADVQVVTRPANGTLTERHGLKSPDAQVQQTRQPRMIFDLTSHPRGGAEPQQRESCRLGRDPAKVNSTGRKPARDPASKTILLRLPPINNAQSSLPTRESDRRTGNPPRCPGSAEL